MDKIGNFHNTHGLLSLSYPPWAREELEPHFFFLRALLVQKNLVDIFFYNFYDSSRAGEFSRHFVCRKSLHDKCGDFQGERRLRISTKMRKTGSTEYYNVMRAGENSQSALDSILEKYPGSNHFFPVPLSISLCAI